MRLVDDLMENRRAHSALLLIDGLKGTVEIKNHEEIALQFHEIIEALNWDISKMNEKYSEIQRNFDSLYYYLNRIWHFIHIGLIEYEDVAGPFQYYISLLAKNKKVHEKYISAINYPLVLDFFNKFDVWANAN